MLSITIYTPITLVSDFDTKESVIVPPVPAVVVTRDRIVLEEVAVLPVKNEAIKEEQTQQPPQLLAVPPVIAAAADKEKHQEQNNENSSSEIKQKVEVPIAATITTPLATNNHNSSNEKKVSAGKNNNELDLEERRKVETRNNNMRQIIYKEVKRPGRNYDRLLDLLKNLHGPAEIRQEYIFEVIKEAMRFKRNHMAKIIEQNMPNLVSIDSSS